MKTIECVVCSVPFISRNSNYKYCSNKCFKLARKIYNHAYNLEHEEEIKTMHDEWHKLHPNWRKEQNTKVYFGSHGTTNEWYNLKLEEQQGHCALCTSEGNGIRLHIDHDHSCCNTRGGKPSCGKCNRGLLCLTCNQRLSHVERILTQASIIPIKDTWVDKSILYLNHYKEIKI